MSEKDHRLLLGPAGSGKTRSLRDAFVEALRAGRESETLLLVPTSSYRDHTRNLVLRESGIRGFSGAAVCTFRDLLERLAPADRNAELSAVRRELLIRRLLRELPLPDLEQVRDFPGFRAALAEAVEEARRAGLDPDALEAALGAGTLSGRHHCFLRFFRAYSTALRQAGGASAVLMDDGQRLTRALESIAGGGLPVRLVLVDGFADFTAEQRQLLVALLGRTPAASVALTLDRQKRDFFYQAQRSRDWLKSFGFREVWLEGNHRARAESLQAVEWALRDSRAEPLPRLWQAEGALAVFATADRRDEAELIGREILRLVRRNPQSDTRGFRYREIGIIVRNPAEYTPLLKGVFRRLEIPLRAFFPVPLLDTAYGRHLLLCLDLFQPGSRPESLLQWLKSPYCPVRSRRLVESFEYRAVERLADARESRWDRCIAPNSFLAAVLDQLAAFDAELAAAGGPQALAAWTARMWREFTRLPEIPDGGSSERVLELRAEAAACRRMDSFLSEFVEAAEVEEIGAIPFAEFRALLRLLMAREQLAIRDRRQDAVNLMNPFEARQWELRVVFVAGMLENEFPAPPREPLFLDDQDREAVEEACGLSLPTTADRALDERLLFYVAATRARERLYFTYPQSDAAGTRLLRSFFLRVLDPLLEPPACRKWERRRSEIVCPPEMAADASDLLALAHTELAARSPDPKALGLALALCESLRSSGATRRAALALAPRPDRLLLEAVLARLREHAVQFSPSAFQTFSSCAYKYFGQYLLKLKGPARPDRIDFQSEGRIVHDTIEQWERGGRSEPIAQALERCFQENTRAIPPGHRGAKSYAEMLHFLERFVPLEIERSNIYRTAVQPEYVELKFGQGEKTPALPLRLADGTVVEIHGRVDRVEVATAEGRKLGLVVDFKYSKDGFDQESLRDIEHGLGLQLPIYLLALEELFGLAPAGAELYPLKADPARRSGIYDAELARHIFRQSAPNEAILLAPGEFRALIARSRRWLERHAESIRGGRIAVFPENPDYCDRCDFYDLCRVKTWEVRQIRERERERSIAR